MPLATWWRQWWQRRQLQQQCRRLGRCPRPVIQSSGLKEWSDREVARLQPRWVKAFFRRHTLRCMVLVLLYLGAVGVFAASLDRYWVWMQTLEAVASPPVKTVNRWQAYCVVKPWSKPCRPQVRSRPVVVPAVLHPALGPTIPGEVGES